MNSKSFMRVVISEDWAVTGNGLLYWQTRGGMEYVNSMIQPFSHTAK